MHAGGWQCRGCPAEQILCAQVNGNIAHPHDNEFFEVMEEIAVGHGNDHLEGHQL